MPEKLKPIEAPAEQPVETERIKPEIPEQRMKRELAKIPSYEREIHERILKGMRLKVTPENITALHKLYELSEPGRYWMNFERGFLLLGESGLIKDTEDLERYGKKLIGLHKYLSEHQGISVGPIDLDEFISKLGKKEVIKSPNDLGCCGLELITISNIMWGDSLQLMLDKGVIKSPNDLHAIVKLHELTRDAEYHGRELGGLPISFVFPNLAKADLLRDFKFNDLWGKYVCRNHLPELVKKDMVKSSEDLKKLVKLYESDVRHIKRLDRVYDELDFKLISANSSTRQIGSKYLDSLVKTGVAKTVEELRDWVPEIEKRAKVADVACDIFYDFEIRGNLVNLAMEGIIKTKEEMSGWISEIKKLEDLLNEKLKEEGFIESWGEREKVLGALLTQTEGKRLTMQDLSSAVTSLLKNPRLISYIPNFSKEELSRLKLQDFSAQLIDLGAKKIAEDVKFPFEKIAQDQKEYLIKMISGLDFIEKNEEVRILIKYGLENTFQKYYDSLEENKQALTEMNKLGINTDVYVYYKGIDKVVFKKTLTGIEKLEAGEEHINDTFQDVVMQLFSNPKGEVFKKPGKVFAELTSLDARDYKTPEERAKAIIEMMLSNDKKWSKEAVSVLEKYLKTTGTPGSMVVDSEEIKGEARTALFHVQEIERLLGMPVKPMKGEAGEIIISVKLSDKNPLTALTNGNDSGCCVAFNGGNRWTLPIYMMDAATQIAEISITKEGKEQRIGQAWLFAGKIGGESTLIIDSINITSSYKNTNEIYEASIGFVKDLAEKAGFKKVILGTTYSDATPYAEEKFEKGNVELLKIHTFKGEIYSDALPDEDEKTATVFVIK
ncbi:MAG: hypothetical protein Sv326_0859 [Candidatus Fermentimicrarchaeum limneticum]|uniref:Uncharacterized protein n=1 Tax=Fermentimicrarchaeum limneticum TaxID=2795018 RepID=A0A7D5XIC5_FERL1|nr:MAG: hypothetical protein Sv326_0859 [Candidatus Fermentimicrarchaeum limneticum]